jgi:hypothetical protein
LIPSILHADGTTTTADTTFDCTAAGQTHAVTLQVIDANNNVGTHTLNVTVLDTLLYHRGKKFAIPTDHGSCVAALSDTLNPRALICSTLTATLSGAVRDHATYQDVNTYEGMTLSAGTHYVTWTVNFGSGSTATVKDTIEVKDMEAPEIVSGKMEDKTYQNDNCESLNAIFWPEPKDYGDDFLVKDNCTPAGALTWTRVDANTATVVWGEHVPAGRWEIQYVATDAAGNKSEPVGFVLTVTTTDTPEITNCPPTTAAMLTVEGGACGATISNDCGLLVDSFCDNTYGLSYKITEAGGSTYAGEGSFELPIGQYSATYTAYNVTNSALSTTSTCTLQVAVLPEASLTVQVMVWVPSDHVVPARGASPP